jgi:hypothetical protein
MTGWVRAIPGPGKLRRRIVRGYIAALRTGRLGGVAAAIQGLGPGPAGGDEGVPPRLLEALRGRSERLRRNPLYRDYSQDYLI